jgi:hypothetical protein
MLECKLCDYYKVIGTNPANYDETAKCEFAGVLFSNDVETLDIEYPCRGISYDQYLHRNTKAVESVNAFRICGDDWRFLYGRCHAADATDRYLRRAI